MGFFSRVKDLVNGFFGTLTGRIEEQNPELLIEDARNRIEKSRKEAERQLIEIQTWSEMVRLEMKSTERNLDDIKYKIDAAAEKGDKELLIELLVQEDEYTQQYQDRKEVFDKAVAEALKIRDQYKQFESEMNARLRELQSIKSQVKLAEMKQSINNLGEKYGFDGKNSDDLNGRMERLREIVTVKTARANAVESLKSEGVEEKIKQLDREIIFKRAEQKADMLLNKHNTETKNVNEATNEGT